MIKYKENHHDMGFEAWWKCKNCETTGPDLNKIKCPRYINEAEDQEQGPKPRKRRKMTEGKDLSKENKEQEDSKDISRKDKKSAQERQDIQNQQKRNIAAHKEVSNFEIPINSPTNAAEESDMQTNHRFFYGPEIRRQAFNKAEQKHKEDKGKHINTHQKQKYDCIAGNFATQDGNTIKEDDYKKKDIEVHKTKKQERQKDSTGNNKKRKTEEEQEMEDHKTSGSSKDYDKVQTKDNKEGNFLQYLRKRKRDFEDSMKTQGNPKKDNCKKQKKEQTESLVQLRIKQFEKRTTENTSRCTTRSEPDECGPGASTATHCDDPT